MYGWSIFILWSDCKQESESENIVKCVYLDVYIRSLKTRGLVSVFFNSDKEVSISEDFCLL